MAARRAAKKARPQRKPDSTQGKITVSIIGAGRLGTALARALAKRGYTIDALVARRQANARRAVELSNTSALALTAKQIGQLPESSLLFITTPDDAVATVAAQLAARFHKGARGRVALHASGALSSESLSDLRAVGFATASLHPLVSVSDPVQGALSLSEAFFCIEGDRAATRTARQIVKDLGAQSFSIATRNKALYHAAAVMTSGHTVALFDIAAAMLARCGLTDARARAVLLPLLRSTVENLATRTPARALTGTFSRADVSTMLRHLAAIRSQADEEALAAYVLLGQHSLQLAGKNGADEQALKEMARVLKSRDEG